MSKVTADPSNLGHVSNIMRGSNGHSYLGRASSSFAGSCNARRRLANDLSVAMWVAVRGIRQLSVLLSHTLLACVAQASLLNLIY